jgi:hypothetical protein
MEQFFTPTCPLRSDLLEESPLGEDPFECNEVQIAVPVEEFLAYNWDWKDLRAFLTDDVTPKVLWITEHAFIYVKVNGHDFHLDFDALDGCVVAIFQETSGQEQSLVLARFDDPDIETGEAGVFWRAITTSNIVTLRINNDDENNLELPSGPLLSKFLRGNLSLRQLDFQEFAFNEEHCRALATLERTDLEVKLAFCTIEPKCAEGTFVEWFRHNQVVTELDRCNMDSSILCALNGNNSVKKLTFDTHLVPIDFREKEIRSLLQALSGNMGIEHLCFSFRLSDKNWSPLFRSLATHPRVRILSLYQPLVREHLSAESKSTMMKAIVQMLHLNTVVQTIELVPDAFSNEEVYRNSILPRLEMNRSCFEVQRQAVKRADPSIRPQVLGRALHVVRYNPNLVFQFLSENVPAFVRTEEEEDSAIPVQNDPAIVSGQKRKAP